MLAPLTLRKEKKVYAVRRHDGSLCTLKQPENSSDTHSCNRLMVTDRVQIADRVEIAHRVETADKVAIADRVESADTLTFKSC